MIVISLPRNSDAVQVEMAVDVAYCISMLVTSSAIAVIGATMLLVEKLAPEVVETSEA